MADDIAEQSTCTEEGAVGVTVDVVRTDGFAAGGVNDCGGATVLWAEVDGAWQEVGATQEAWECSLLEEYRIPNDVLFGDGTCYDAEAGRTRTYTQA